MISKLNLIFYIRDYIKSANEIEIKKRIQKFKNQELIYRILFDRSGLSGWFILWEGDPKCIDETSNFIVNKSIFKYYRRDYVSNVAKSIVRFFFPYVPCAFPKNSLNILERIHKVIAYSLMIVLIVFIILLYVSIILSSRFSILEALFINQINSSYKYLWR